MAATYRAGSTFGDGQTATTASLPIVIPASAQVGDVVTVDFHDTVDNTTIATPTGWTALDSSPAATPSSNTSFLFAKEVAAGEPGSTVTFTASSARRFAGTITVYSGVTLAGYVLVKVTDAATTTAPVLPTAAGVPAGAMIVAIYSRRVNVVGNAVGTITFPGYTAAVDESTAYTASPQAHVAALHKVAGAAGSYGGETGAASVTGFGTRYVLALPATGGSAGTGTAGGAVAFTGAASGSSPRRGAATGATAWAGTAAGTTSRTGTASGTAIWTGAASGSTQRTGTASGAVAWTGSATGAAPSGPPTHLPGTVSVHPHLSAAVLAGDGRSTASLAAPAYATGAVLPDTATATLGATQVGTAALERDGTSTAALVPGTATATLST